MTQERTVHHLRSFLFDQLERLGNAELKGETLKEEIERAKVVQATAGRIIESAKAQTDRIRALGDIRQPVADPFLEGESTRPALTSGGSS